MAEFTIKNGSGLCYGGTDYFWVEGLDDEISEPLFYPEDSRYAYKYESYEDAATGMLEVKSEHPYLDLYVSAL